MYMCVCVDLAFTSLHPTVVISCKHDGDQLFLYFFSHYSKDKEESNM